MITSREYVKSILLDIAWFEAASLGGIKPIQMVAQCIANRVRNGAGHWGQVFQQIYFPGRYYLSQHVLTDRLIAKVYPDVSDPRFSLMLPAIDQIYENTFEDIVKGGVYWADLGCRMLDHRFVHDIISNTEEHPRTAQSGQLCTWS